MYVYKVLTIVALTAVIFGFTHCIGTQSQLVWQAPQEIAGSEEAFEKTVYPITRANCINCHTTQAPTHAADDPKAAHTAALSKVNFANIPNSRLVLKLRNDQHNCWGDCAANADEMQAAIEDWYDMIKKTDAQSPTPVIQPPPMATVLKTAETKTIEMELANMANPLKSNTVSINVGSAMVNAPMVKATDGFGDFLYVPDDGQNQTLVNNDASAGVAMRAAQAART